MPELSWVNANEEIESTNEYHFIVMTKYKFGSTLDFLNTAINKQVIISLDLIQFLSREILIDLMELHKLHHAHLDTKLDNIMFNDQRMPILIDFGSSKELGMDIDEWTTTPEYAPPEVYKWD